MGKKGRKGNKNYAPIQLVIGLVVIACICIIGNFRDIDLLENLTQDLQDNSLENTNNYEDTSTSKVVSGNLVIDFIDVGQGDSILIRQGQNAMLIDGGTSECRDELLNFLEEEKIKKFDYIIGTHTHEDHIGSLDDVVNEYDFDKIIFPKCTSTTETFENLVNAVNNKNKKFTTPKVGEKYELGEASFEILAPNDDNYSSANNYSIVIKLTFGENSFLFTGDAETLSENEMLEKGLNVKADVIKIGHHGSTTSSSKKFLDAVSAKYAVISVGKDNIYKLPTKTTMDKLKELELPVYRTDEQGTIECVSDGKNITFNVDPGSYDYMNGR